MNKCSTLGKIFCCLIVMGLTSLKSFADSDELAKIKRAIKEEGLNWIAKETWISRLFPQQSKKFFMQSYHPPVLAKSKLLTLPQKGDLPSSLDWRNISQNGYQGNYVTPIRDQGECGSCWAFSAVAQIESWWLIDNNRPDTTLDLSEQILVSKYAGCDGGLPEYALIWAQQKGIPPEWCFEYRARNTPLDSAYADWEDYVYKIPGWNYITNEEADLNNIKNALMYHPVTAMMEVYNDFRYFYKGIYEPTRSSIYLGGHGILIIGWNDADSCWICKNSWGPDWGETEDFVTVESGVGNGGYFRIKWGVCGIGEYIPFIWNEGEVENYFTIKEERVHITLTQDETTETSITLANSGPDDISFAAFDYSAKVTFHVDDFNAYEGTSWWCGDPELEGYDRNWLQYLQTPILDLSSTKKPTLNWQGYWAVEDTSFNIHPPYDGLDGCNVWISTDGGSNFTVIEPEFPEYDCQNLWSFVDPFSWNLGSNIAGWTGNSDGWKEVELDLSDYNSEAVILRWAFASDCNHRHEDDPSLYGFFVDDIIISDGDTVIFENYGEDNDEMVVDGFSRNKPTDWLTIKNGVGTVSAGSQFSVHLGIDTKNLEPGYYKGLVSFLLSDTILNRTIIPIFLTVGSKEADITDYILNSNPYTIRLYENYPNPFNPNTEISYYLPERSFVKLRIYDIRGRQIRTLVNKIQYPGLKQIIWNGTNNAGKTVSSGMYIYTLQTGQKVISKKMLLIR